MMMKHVKLPQFDGTDNVEGWFFQFEESCDALDATPSNRKVLLLGQLKGTAHAWALGKRSQLATLTYGEVKAEIIRHFQGEILSKVRQVEELRQNNKPLHEHNTKFAGLAAAASD
jgi:hypothetical protein